MKLRSKIVVEIDALNAPENDSAIDECNLV